MSVNNKENKRKIIKWIFWRIPIALMIFFAVIIVSLKFVERYPNPLRQGFEEYLSSVSHGNATIGHLEKVQFFPNFIIQANDITIHNSENAAIIKFEIKQIDMSYPFSTLFFHQKKINSFDLKGLHANKNIIGPKELKIEEAKIINKKGPDQFGSFMVAEGLLGGEKSKLEFELEVKKYNYEIPSDIPFTLIVGEYSVSAYIKRNFKSVVLKNLVFNKGKIQTIAKDYVLIKDHKIDIKNPLACLWNEEQLENCDQYLN